ncbi:prepilin peptidase [Actinomyces minihominis]|uniref:prepilin peptidase n=1 Tax=Actinomyces minihominis TaxID=2002838 RepID=UPI000C07B080|nr:prepilin peptidase [Actinomyces minihominis]
MTGEAVQLLAALVILTANLLWLGLTGSRLLSRYLPAERLRPVTLVWGSALTGSLAIYLGAVQRPSLPGGWGWGDAGTGVVVGIGVVLTSLGWISILIDSRTLRLPDPITGLMALEVLLFVLLPPALGHVGSAWFWAITLGAVTWTVPLVVGFRLGQVGRGDIKLAPVLGAALATCSFRIAVLGLLAAFTVAALRALFLMARPGSQTRFPFGPYMVGSALGCWVLAAVGPMVLV